MVHFNISIINGGQNVHILNLSPFNLSCELKARHNKATHHLSRERLCQLVGRFVFCSCGKRASLSGRYSKTHLDLRAASSGFLPKWLVVCRGDSRSGPLERVPLPPLSILPIIHSGLGDQPAQLLTAVRGHPWLRQAVDQGLCFSRTRTSKAFFLVYL